MADGAGQLIESRSELHDARRFKPAIGRPTIRNEAVIAEICKELEAGRTLRQACEPKHLPNRPTVLDWMREDEELRKRIADARARGCDALAEESYEIADEASGDLLTDKDGRVYGNGAAISRAKLRIETRLKLAALWNRKEYGERQQIDVQGTLGLEHLVLSSIHAAQPEPAPGQLLNVTPVEPAADPYEDLL